MARKKIKAFFWKTFTQSEPAPGNKEIKTVQKSLLCTPVPEREQETESHVKLPLHCNYL